VDEKQNNANRQANKRAIRHSNKHPDDYSAVDRITHEKNNGSVHQHTHSHNPCSVDIAKVAGPPSFDGVSEFDNVLERQNSVDSCSTPFEPVWKQAKKLSYMLSGKLFLIHFFGLSVFFHIEFDFAVGFW